jgi:hypothetical protein
MSNGVIITAIICLTIVAVSLISKDNKKNRKDED